jgi:hypothetical protein
MPSNRGPLNERHVADALRLLAAEHARKREPFDKRRAWLRIEQGEPRAARSLSETSHWRLALAALVFVAGAIAGGSYWKSAATLSYEARGASLVDGNLSTAESSAQIAFSDTSHIAVGPHAALSLEIVGRHAALTRLERGQLHVRVQHAKDTNWRFFAGRYEVQVVGTEFDLAWDEHTEQFLLRMLSGEVRVLGAPGPARVVGAGATLRLPESSASVATTAAPTPSPKPMLGASSEVAGVSASNASAATASAATASAATGMPATGSNTASASKPTHDTGASDWDTLLKAGQFAAVVQSAESAGVEHSLQAASASNLKALAQAARYTGHAPLSLRAWHALRARFESQPLGTQASFFLGRTYDEQGNLPEALHWLGRYVSEAPNGVYASEAFGRRLLVLQKFSGRSAALSSARDYLQRFPGGAFEKTARAIVEAE